METVNSYPDRTAPVTAVLRLGLGAVFLAFGVWKSASPVQWVIFLPNWVSGAVADLSALDALGVLRMMGFVEAVLGIQLLAGLFTKATATLCTALLAGIVFHVGFDQVGIRDAGLLFAAMALMISGGGRWSVDHLLDSEKVVESEI